MSLFFSFFLISSQAISPSPQNSLEPPSQSINCAHSVSFCLWVNRQTSLYLSPSALAPLPPVSSLSSLFSHRQTQLMYEPWHCLVCSFELTVENARVINGFISCCRTPAHTHTDTHTGTHIYTPTHTCSVRRRLWQANWRGTDSDRLGHGQGQGQRQAAVQQQQQLQSKRWSLRCWSAIAADQRDYCAQSQRRSAAAQCQSQPLCAFS